MPEAWVNPSEEAVSVASPSTNILSKLRRQKFSARIIAAATGSDDSVSSYY
jgi:hypothetical protein